MQMWDVLFNLCLPCVFPYDALKWARQRHKKLQRQDAFAPGETFSFFISCKSYSKCSESGQNPYTQMSTVCQYVRFILSVSLEIAWIFTAGKNKNTFFFFFKKKKNKSKSNNYSRHTPDTLCCWIFRAEAESIQSRSWSIFIARGSWFAEFIAFIRETYVTSVGFNRCFGKSCGAAELLGVSHLLISCCTSWQWPQRSWCNIKACCQSLASAQAAIAALKVRTLGCSFWNVISSRRSKASCQWPAKRCSKKKFAACSNVHQSRSKSMWKAWPVLVGTVLLPFSGFGPWVWPLPDSTPEPITMLKDSTLGGGREWALGVVPLEMLFDLGHPTWHFKFGTCDVCLDSVAKLP